jgi:uncharacterized protein (DUF488 family)
MFYTIGYQTLTPDFLKKLVSDLDVILVDVRSSTRSRIRGFGGRQLEALLAERYAHRPDLGGRAGPKGITKQAIAGLFEQHEEALANGRRGLMLMCLEHSPGDCHRHLYITSRHIPDAVHIYDDEVFTSEALAVSEKAGPTVPYAPWGDGSLTNHVRAVRRERAAARRR